METLFVDRTLACSDCHSEFIFTAGEQLFFHDKQFKNDPKRCKPCKSRRSGLAAAANGTGPVAAGISRTETRTECSECKIETTVPFKPTQGRPVLCRQCFQARSRAGKPFLPPGEVPSSVLPLAAAELPNLSAAPLFSASSETVAALTEASVNTNGEILSAEAAILAAASMSAASPASSVASAADLASILNVPTQPDSEIPTELLAAAQANHSALIPAELLPEAAEA